MVLDIGSQLKSKPPLPVGSTWGIANRDKLLTAPLLSSSCLWPCLPSRGNLNGRGGRNIQNRSRLSQSPACWIHLGHSHRDELSHDLHGLAQGSASILKEGWRARVYGVAMYTPLWGFNRWPTPSLYLSRLQI